MMIASIYYIQKTTHESPEILHIFFSKISLANNNVLLTNNNKKSQPQLKNDRIWPFFDFFFFLNRIKVEFGFRKLH